MDVVAFLGQTADIHSKN